MQINNIVKIASEEGFREKVILPNFTMTPVSCTLNPATSISETEIESVFVYLLRANNFTQWAIGDVGSEMQWRGLDNVINSICEYYNKSYPRVCSNIRVCRAVPVDLRKERVQYTIYETICESKNLTDSEKENLIHDINNADTSVKTRYLRNLVNSKIAEKNPDKSHEGKVRIGLKAHPFEPTHEEGVVALFGILSEALGFRILHMQSNFPDCIAERKTFRGRGGRKTEWETIFIELQLKASDFLRDKHDYTKCNIIVCWENDLTSVPNGFEIIELKSELEKLKSRKPALFDR